MVLRLKKSLAYLFFFLLIPSISANIYINEIMYNPSGSDNNMEFVEIYSDTPINLTGYTIEDVSSSDTLLVLNYTNSQYALIVESGFNYTGISASIYSVGATIGNNLNNDEDTFILRDAKGKIVDIVSYQDSWGADGNGFSLERKDINAFSGNPLNWKESESPGGTPGIQNAISTLGCDWNLSLLINDVVSKDPTWQIRTSKITGSKKANITIDHWITDAEGNIIKTYNPIIVTNAVSQSTSSTYTPSLTENQGYFLNANISNISCQDNNENNYLSELIFLPGEAISTFSSSNIIIKTITPDDPSFGKIVKVKIDIYRGNTAKYAVYAYIEDDDNRISEKTTLHINTKYINQSFTIPIQLKSNCNEKYEDGKYEVIVEGLDVFASKKIEIKGLTSTLCKASTSSTTKNSVIITKNKISGNLEYGIVSKPEKIEIGAPFQTEVDFKNHDDKEMDINVWSYVYRGSKSYSGLRESNLRSFTLDPDESKKISLFNTVSDASQGEYKFKVKIRKNNQKTTKDITSTIQIIKKTQEVSVEQNREIQRQALNQPFNQPYIRSNPIAIYESSSFKAKKMIPSVMMAAMASAFLLFGFLKKSF